jgi:peptide/nickel transport system substrate-binding protein
MQVEDEILRKLESGGAARGGIVILPGGGVEYIQLNASDPWTEVDGERSSAKTQHPLFSDRAVCQALTLLVDRSSVETFVYGRTGTATGNFINKPQRFVSKNTIWEFNVGKANQLLDAAGWKRGSDGIRTKDGKRLKLVYHSRSTGRARRRRQLSSKPARRPGSTSKSRRRRLRSISLPTWRIQIFRRSSPLISKCPRRL